MINAKRTDYIDWDEFFMGTACLAAQRSKDSYSQIGACVLNKNGIIVSVGYNGMPIGCSDDIFPWMKENEEPLLNKKYYVCHAEMNAIILNKNAADLTDGKIYVNLFPCNECTKLIIQAGIKEVVYLSDKLSHKVEYRASKLLLEGAGIKYRKYEPKKGSLVINFNKIHE